MNNNFLFHTFFGGSRVKYAVIKMHTYTTDPVRISSILALPRLLLQHILTDINSYREPKLLIFGVVCRIYSSMQRNNNNNNNDSPC